MNLSYRRLLTGSVLLAATAAVAMSGLPAVTAADASTSQTVPAQRSIRWGSCPTLAVGVSRDPRQVCGRVSVPLDYRRPNGPSIHIEVSRISTATAGQRRGFLLVNPGGPAVEGLNTPGMFAQTLPKKVLNHYDLIGFDPRGVGHSTPQSCGLTDASISLVFPFPAPNGSIRANVAAARATAKQCATIGATLRYFTTANTARDLDRIRRALDVSTISYWGQSYGTYIGAVYASLFPRHTDRIILEGNVDPYKIWAGQSRLWAQGMVDRFPDAARVAADDRRLGLGSTVAQVTKTYLALASHLDRTPAAVPGTPAAIDGSLLRDVTYSLLLHNESLPMLTQFWKAASDLAGSRSPSAVDQAVLGQIFASTPAEPGVPADNQITMIMSLICGDASFPRNISNFAAAVKANRAQFPLTDGMPANIWPCAFWHYAPIERPVTITSHGPRNILILQNRRDNATPWAGALGMRRALGSRAGFVGVDNGGHYVYGTGSTCADTATNRFLLHGTPPAERLYCAPPSR